MDFEAFVYDAAGRVTLTERRDGQTVTLSHDALGRLTARALSGAAADDVFIDYDLLGRAVAVTKGDGDSILTSYDRASRPVSVAAGGRTLGYGYDAAGRRTSMSWPDGFSVTYDRDILGRMTAIRENGGAVLAGFTHDDAGIFYGLRRRRAHPRPWLSSLRCGRAAEPCRSARPHTPRGARR